MRAPSRRKGGQSQGGFEGGASPKSRKARRGEDNLGRPLDALDGPKFREASKPANDGEEAGANHCRQAASFTGQDVPDMERTACR